MRVCFISREFYRFRYGGIGTQLYYQMKLLQNLGHDITFITQKPDNFNRAILDKYYAGIDVQMIDFIGEDQSHFALDYSFQVEAAFARLSRRNRPDLVILADFDGEGFVIFFKRWIQGKYKNIPFVLGMHGPLTEIIRYNNRRTDPYERVICHMEDFCLKSADYLLAPSQRIWDEVSGRLQLDEARSRLIPNSLNRDLFFLAKPKKKKASEKRIIVYSGRIEPIKGVDLLLEAFIELQRADPNLDLNLILVGRDYYWPAYRSTFEVYWQKRLPPDLKERVHFTGHVDPEKLVGILQEAWVCVFPSRWETFGIAALEAISCGAPVVISAGTGLEEVVGSHYGYSFNTGGGANGLKKVLVKILTDTQLRNHLSEQLYDRAATMIENTDSILHAFFEQLASQYRFRMEEVDSEALGRLAFAVFEAQSRFNLHRKDVVAAQVKKAWQKVEEKNEEIFAVWENYDKKDEELRDLWKTYELDMKRAGKQIKKTVSESRKAWKFFEKKDSELRAIWQKYENEVRLAWEAYNEKNEELKDLWLRFDELNEENSRLAEELRVLSEKVTETADHRVEGSKKADENS